MVAEAKAVVEKMVSAVGVVKEGMVGAWSIVTGARSFDENKRILGSETDFLKARIDDFTAGNTRQGRKRTRDDDNLWLALSLQLFDEAENLSRLLRAGWPLKRRQAREGTIYSFSLSYKVHKLIKELAGHEMKANVLWRGGTAAFELDLPLRGNHIPVKEMIGLGALNALEQLTVLLADNEVGNIAICGKAGIGKTILMKHLHNQVLKWVERFDFVFWITFPEQFSVHHLQDVVAAAVKCDISNISDLTVRAETLYSRFGNLGRCIIFLDGVPNAIFSLKLVGIPDPSEGYGCKLVLTTRFNPVPEMLGCSEIVRLNCLPEGQALELFLHEARLGAGSVPLLEDKAKSIAKECQGVPSKIVDVAKSLCGIDDIREWRNTLFELRTREASV